MIENDKIVFIVGNSRSGTTMLGRILGKHSQIYTFKELHFFEQQVDESTVQSRKSWNRDDLFTMLERLITSARDGLFNSVIPNKYHKDVEQILNLSQGEDPVSVYECFLREETKVYGKVIPCEQTPRYLFSAEAILASFPNARVINLVRDPRDVLLSQKNKWRRRFLGAKNIPLTEAFRSWINYHPYTISKLWVSTIRAAQKLEKNERFISLHFEDLLNNPKKNVIQLCDFIGLNYEANMLNVPQVGSSIGVDYPDKVGIDNTRTLGWKKGGLSEVELVICQNVGKQEMEYLGYALEPISISFWKKWLSMLTFVLKISVALLLNLRRSKNIIQSISHRLIKPQKQVL